MSLVRQLEREETKLSGVIKKLREMQAEVGRLEALLESKIEAYKLTGAELVVFRTNDERALRVSHEMLMRATGDLVMTVVLRPGETFRPMRKRGH